MSNPGISLQKHMKKCVFGVFLKLTNIKSFLTERGYSNEARSASIQAIIQPTPAYAQLQASHLFLE